MTTMPRPKQHQSTRRMLAVPFVCLSLLLSVSACTQSRVNDEWPALSYQAASPVMVNASYIEISDAYRSPMGAPNVEHLFKVTPSMAAQDLVRHQVTAGAASNNVLRVIVEEASVVRSTLPKKDGVVGFFTPEPEEQFDARVSLKFELADAAAPDVVTGRASVLATRQRTLSGGATLAQRERAYRDLTQDLVNDLAQGIGTTVKGTLGVQ